jgi:thioredoxin-related protein
VRKYFFIAFILLLAVTSKSQDSTSAGDSTTIIVPDSISWLTFEEAVTLNKLEKRKIVVFIYTDWCAICKRMENTTFQDTVVKILLSDNYYAVRLNAESKDTIAYKGNKFSNVYFSDYKKNYHELAVGLAEFDVTFPALVFLDETERRLHTIKGYKNADYINSILGYYLDDMHLKQQKTGFGQNFRYNCQNPSHPHNRLNQAARKPDVSIPEK